MPSPDIEQSKLAHQQATSPTLLHAREERANPEHSGNGVPSSDTAGANSTNEAIQEGKQKARAVMASSGLAIGDTAVQGPSSSIEAGLSSGGNRLVNGVSPSRKRSRSGTRITHSPKSREMRNRASSEERKWKRDKELEQFVTRDIMFLGTVKMDEMKQSRLTTSLKAQRNQYEEMLYRDLLHPDERKEIGRRGVRQRPTAMPGAVFGKGYVGYGNPTTNVTQGPPMTILYPNERSPAGGRRTRHPTRSKKDMATQAEQIEDLVPIRLDIEWDKIRLRDTFTWNLHDRVTDLRAFAEGLVEDFALPPDQCAPVIDQVHSSIEEQIREYHPHVFIREEPLDPHLPYHAYKDDEMRITIKLNLTIGQSTLVDQFEWDINNPANCAEDFARSMTQDLSLSGEFTTAIAHSIREQSQLFTRGLYVTNHPFDGRPIEDQELKAGFLASPLPSSFRPFQAAKDFTPYLYELNEAELEKTELSLSREERRQKRSVTRRGGPALPDLKDRRRTIRTLIVSSVIPNSAEAIEDSRILKRAPVAPGKARRPGHVKDGLDDSEESDSADSSPGSPAVPSYLMTGTARTRNMRGAATAASAAIRGHVGRSATPEVSNVFHTETRTSRRQLGGASSRGKEYREESIEESTEFIVKLKLPREKYRQLMRALKNKARPEALLATASTPQHSSRRSQSGTPGHSTAAAGSMPPPTTPGIQSQAQRSSPNRHGHQVQHQPSGQIPHSLLHPHSAANIGRVDAAGPPSDEHPAPDPPSWLLDALGKLQKAYPKDLFEGVMRYTAVNIATDQPVALTNGQPQEEIKYMFYPRIRCLDCVGKLYTPGPDYGVNNFEVHLRNKAHRDKVVARAGAPSDERN
ncbi:MAG: hypothetical protein Q9174_000042 [Haloplaca sp. 1 TL-2023]